MDPRYMVASRWWPLLLALAGGWQAAVVVLGRFDWTMMAIVAPFALLQAFWAGAACRARFDEVGRPGGWLGPIRFEGDPPYGNMSDEGGA